MNIFEIFGNLTIGPLKLMYEFIFSIAYNFSHDIALSIILLSLTVNILVLPLYKRADDLQEEERKKQESMKKGIDHIKKSFRGDERMMMLQTYYRQNDYNPIYVLKSSVSLLLQIPFFIAAYQFLSNLTMLNGYSLGPVKDFGMEDCLLKIGNFPINTLPILMTVINIISGTIFTKGKSLKTKIQLYAMALVFLVLLYKSPSGLVFYWTLNNIFSLGKNIVQKIIESLKEKNHNISEKKKSPLFEKIQEHNLFTNIRNNDVWLFFASGIFICVLIGIYAPSNVIQSSVIEFTHPKLLNNPIVYVFYSVMYSVGFFLIWSTVFFILANKKIKNLINEFMISLCFIFTFDYMAFGLKNNSLSPSLQYLVYKETTISMLLINISVIIAIFVLVHVIYRYKTVIFSIILPAFVLTIVVLSSKNVSKIINDYNNLYYIKDDLSSEAAIELSQNGQNVVVIMLDRALGSQFPYIINEIPELKEEFDGFTYYRNTVSFGCVTNAGAPALFGGYEYTPNAMNENPDSLKDKHNEALKVMPVLFSDEGYDVTVFDPPYANYLWYPDLSIYDEYPDVKAYNLEFMFNPDVQTNAVYMDTLRKRNFFCYSLMSCSPIFLKDLLYDDALYNKEVAYYENGTLSGLQIMENTSKAHGKKVEFMDWYYALDNLSNITSVSENSKGSFVMMDNCITHEPMMLQRPDYTVSDIVDNTQFDSDLSSYNIDGIAMKMENSYQVSHYHTNVLALKEVAKWLRKLKELGVYDNTRIIIVSDHGADLDQFRMIDERENNLEYFLPLLMVKDYNSTGFNVSKDFMTNADVVGFAVKDIFEDPVNPFSGNKLDGHEKNDELKLLYMLKGDVSASGETTYIPGDWYTVSGDVYDTDNWEYIGTW